MAHKEKTIQPGKPTVEDVQADMIKALKKLILKLRDSHRRMLENEKLHKEPEEYGPDTTKSIEVQEALDLI